MDKLISKLPSSIQFFIGFLKILKKNMIGKISKQRKSKYIVNIFSENEKIIREVIFFMVE